MVPNYSQVKGLTFNNHQSYTVPLHSKGWNRRPEVKNGRTNTTIGCPSLKEEKTIAQKNSSEKSVAGKVAGDWE